MQLGAIYKQTRQKKQKPTLDNYGDVSTYNICLQICIHQSLPYTGLHSIIARRRRKLDSLAEKRGERVQRACVHRNGTDA